MDRAALVRRLREKGAELGLSAVGVASTAPSDNAAFLERWLEAGYAGTMAWMQRTAAVRADLEQRFPWVRSAVVTASSYLSYEGAREEQPGLVRHVARYALGDDYHRVLKRRLEVLAAFLIAEGGASEARVYVDTGPVLERELAARAGLGWVGKNTNLILPGGDSWVLLGEILTDLDLPRDDPAPDRCGTCTACLEACPTGALPEPHLLDATRCLSYLTIELRGAVPREARPWLDDWVLGCDLCQEVCPWNRKVAPTADAAFGPARHLREGRLADLVGLGAKAYREHYRPTALERPRRRGLARNALIVAANLEDQPALDAAVGALDDEDAVVRGAAAWALGRAGGTDYRRALERARERERDPAAREEIDAALEGTGSEPQPGRPVRA